jgi:hypothetical protein
MWAAGLGLMLSVGCGKEGGSGTPTGPTPGAPPLVTLSDLNIPDRIAVVRWTTVQGATEYEIAVGTTAGGEDVAKLTVPASTSTATLPNLPPASTIHVRVTPRVEGVTSGSYSFYLLDFRGIVETLFFGSGPYGESQFSGGALTVMQGWAPGTRIRIRLANEVEDLRPTAEIVANQLAQMTGGVLTASVESGGDNLWQPSRQGPAGTVKVVSTKELPQDLCGGNRFDCARADADSNPIRTRVMLWMGPDLLPGNRHPVFAHELGHALLGFVHWGGYFNTPGAMGSTFACRPNTPELQYPYLKMCGRQEEISRGLPAALRDDFTPIEMEAARRVYAAGLRPGASRAEFASLGLIP